MRPSNQKQCGRVGIWLLIFACIPMLAGCTVGPVAYERFQIKNAAYFGNVCYGGGPPSLAYYPYHGVFISLALDATLQFGLHVPPGYTVSLESSEVRITGRTANGATVRTIAVLRALPHGSFGATAPRTAPFLWRPDPYISGAALSNLGGGGNRTEGYYWYVFGMFANEGSVRFEFLPPDVIEGVVEVPPMEVNGYRYPSQKIRFVREKVVKIMPVNC